jgi:uncharacterized protein
MMTVVSDTTAISNLLHTGQLQLLRDLFGKVIVPQQVLGELGAVAGFAEAISKADYIVVVNCSAILDSLQQNDALDEGEKAAISYAVDNTADLLIIDELNGRKAATALGLNIIGTIGILLLAKKKKIIKTIRQYLDDLRANGFWISEKIYVEALKLANE